jgi:predicted Fe-Mo cluster-binding NifX family protein
MIRGGIKMNSKNNLSATGHFTGKVAIATNDLRSVTGHLGRCRSFIVVTIEDGKVITTEVRQNTFTHHQMAHEHHEHHGHGEGHHSHEGLINGLRDCKFIVSQGGGWRIVEDLKIHNISTLFTDVDLIDEVISKLISGELENQEDLTCRDHGQ